MNPEGIVEGEYKNYKIKADCKYVMNLIFKSSYESCDIYVNGQKEMVLKMEQPGT